MTTFVGLYNQKCLLKHPNFFVPWKLTATSDNMPNSPNCIAIMNDFSLPNQTTSHISPQNPTLFSPLADNLTS